MMWKLPPPLDPVCFVQETPFSVRGVGDVVVGWGVSLPVRSVPWVGWVGFSSLCSVLEGVLVRVLLLPVFWVNQEVVSPLQAAPLLVNVKRMVVA